jgi:hypothetical protein
MFRSKNRSTTPALVAKWPVGSRVRKDPPPVWVYGVLARILIRNGTPLRSEQANAVLRI